MSIKRDCLEKAGFDVNGIYARNPELYHQVIEAMELYAKAVKNNAVLPLVSNNEVAVCDNCRDGFWLRKNSKCLICGKINLCD